MEKNDMNNNLSDQMKKDLRESESKEELDALVSSAGMEITDEALDGVTGGYFGGGCNCYYF
jgi:hypothetical protein